MIRERILFRLFFSLLLLLSFSPFCTYESTFQIHPKDFKAYESDPFTAMQDAVANAHENACDMMVFHPGYIDAYLLDHSSMTTTRVRETDMLCNPAVCSWLNEQDIALVSYNDLK